MLYLEKQNSTSVNIVKTIPHEQDQRPVLHVSIDSVEQTWAITWDSILSEAHRWLFLIQHLQFTGNSTLTSVAENCEPLCSYWVPSLGSKRHQAVCAPVHFPLQNLWEILNRRFSSHLPVKTNTVAVFLSEYPSMCNMNGISLPEAYFPEPSDIAHDTS